MIIACGTSYHAGLIGRYAMTEWARMPVGADIASEYRYSNPVVGEGDLVIGITQSGETADTLAAMRLAQRARRDGPRGHERHGLAGHARQRRGRLHARRPGDRRRGDQDVRLPGRGDVPARAAPGRAARHAAARAASPSSSSRSRRCPSRSTTSSSASTATARSTGIAAQHGHCPFFLYLGRHAGLPVALEGALKLKEISYIPTDAYAAGEMKHGPIALLDESTPVIVAATDSPVLDKVVSNMQEVRARGAHVIAVATEGNVDIGEHAEEVIRVPDDRLDAPAAAGDHPAAARRLRDRALARAERRPAAQPREDGHGRVGRG